MYHLYIDETGNFQEAEIYNSFVCGIFCHHDIARKLKENRDQLIAKHNEEYFNVATDKKLSSELLHAAVLYFGKNPHTNESNNYPEAIGKAFINRTASFLNDQEIYLFRTEGKPIPFIHPRQAYGASLFALITGLFRHPPVKDLRSEGIHIHFATRKTIDDKEILDFGRYHNSLKKSIKEIIIKSQFFNDRAPIRVTSEKSDSGNAELQFADMACWISRKINEYSHLYNESKIRIFPTSLFYRISLNATLQQELLELDKNGYSDQALVTALNELSFPQSVRDAKNYLKDKIADKLRSDSSVNTRESILAYLDTILEERNQSTDNIKRLGKVSEFLIETLSKEVGKSALYVLKAALFNLLHYEAHTGSTKMGESSAYQKIIAFLDEYETILYPDLFPRLQFRYECLLISVQISDFNTLEFQKVADTLKNQVDTYYKIRSVLSQMSSAQKQRLYDATYARLMGTLGQASAFLFATTHDIEIKEEALLQLTEDFENIDPSSGYYQHGASFLASWHWWNKELDLNKKFAAISAGCENSDSAFTAFCNHFIQTGVTGNDPAPGFKLLDILRHIGLNIELTGTIADINYLNLLRKLSETNLSYPYSLCAKWCACILSASGNYNDEADSLFQRFITEGEGGMQSLLIKSLFIINLKMVRNVCNGEAPVNTDIITALNELALQNPGLKVLLNHRSGFVIDNQLSVWETAKFLPYYFS